MERAMIQMGWAVIKESHFWGHSASQLTGKEEREGRRVGAMSVIISQQTFLISLV